MENNKKYIIVAFAILFIIIFYLLVRISGLKTKTCPSCPICEVCKKETVNETKEDKNDSKETFTIENGKALWNVAYDFYWGFVKNAKLSTINANKLEITNYSEFDFSIFTTNGKSEFNKYYNINNSSSKYYVEFLIERKDDKFMEPNDFVIKNSTSTKITYTINYEYCAEGENEDCKDIAKIENEFTILKEDGKWLIESFILPD